MKYPNFNEEKKFWKKGLKFVVGIDEAGRGPLAGPVVAGAVLFKIKKEQVPRAAEQKLKSKVINQKSKIKNFGVRDSKKLIPKQREKVYNYFKKNPDIEWGIGIVSQKVIDRINILEATKLAMIKSVKDLEKKLEKSSSTIDQSMVLKILIIDGNIKLNINLAQKSIIKADQKVFSCALASIFAKVTRDKIMQKYHKKYPEYGFDKHKGYGTTRHFKMLKKYGPCKIHRKSFYPVKSS